MSDQNQSCGRPHEASQDRLLIEWRGAAPGRVLLIAVAIVFVLVTSAAYARGVLLEGPESSAGMPLFPRRTGAFYSAGYGINGVRVTVYYSDRELDVPEFSDSEACGGYTLHTIEDADFEVRYLSIEGEHVFFLWEPPPESDAEMGLCGYIPSFADRYAFFARNFPSDLHSRLPAIITE